MLDISGYSGRRSSIFKPGGQIGLVCDGKTFCLNNLGQTSFIIVSALNQFIVYESLSLKVVFISLPLKCNVKSIAAKFENTFLVLSDNSFHSFHKYDSREILHKHQNEITGVLFHCDTLISYSSSELNTYFKNEAKDGNSSSSWSFEREIKVDENSNINTIVPLEGMNNKVLVGLSDSRMVLLNFRSGKILYTFSPKVEDRFKTEDLKGVRVICQSGNKNCGIVAVGYNFGYVSIIDVNKDEFLGGFTISNGKSSVVSLTFVFDHLGITNKSSFNTEPSELLVAGTESGELVVFSLSKFVVISNINSNSGPVKSLFYIPHNKFLISTGENSIVVWNLDCEKSFLRELKSRRGFIGNIDLISFYDVEENEILVSSSKDGVGYLGKVSTIQQHQSVTFSTKSVKQKLKKITGISSAYQRHFDWPNIVTCHANTHQVHVWSGFKRGIIDKSLKVPGMNSTATCLCLTKCGNYAIVGYENGQVHLFTLQNCNYDTEFNVKVEDQLSPAHVSKVIHISLLGNAKIVTIANRERVIRVWDVMKVKLDFEYEVELPIGTFPYLATVGNHLTALACNDNTIYILDVIGSLIIRKFTYQNKITSMRFNMNDNWLVLSSDNSTMLVYDILSSCFVDYVKFSGKVFDHTLDSSSSILYLSSDKAPGIILQYSNKHAFELFPKSILYKSIPKEPIPIDIQLLTELDCDENDEVEEVEVYKSKTSQIESGLITLSSLNTSKLQSILYLDEVKEKSKPKQPPKLNKDLPFFLPTSYKDGQLIFVEPEPEDELPEQNIPSSLLKSTNIKTEFEILLHSQSPTKYEEMMKYLLNQTPSMVNLSLSLFSESNMEHSLLEMLKFFQFYVERKENVDAIQVFIHLFIKFHAERLVKLNDKDVFCVMEKLKEELKQDYKFLQESFDKISCYIKFLTHLQMDNSNA